MNENEDKVDGEGANDPNATETGAEAIAPDSDETSHASRLFHSR